MEQAMEQALIDGPHRPRIAAGRLPACDFTGFITLQST